MSSLVLSIIASNSARSCCGTPNLSSVWLKSSVKACHSSAVISRFRWESTSVPWNSAALATGVRSNLLHTTTHPRLSQVSRKIFLHLMLTAADGYSGRGPCSPALGTAKHPELARPGPPPGSDGEPLVPASAAGQDGRTEPHPQSCDGSQGRRTQLPLRALVHPRLVACWRGVPGRCPAAADG